MPTGLGKGTAEPMALLAGAAVLCVLLCVGITVFTRSARTFIDTV